jgi:hypothetical protein
MVNMAGISKELAVSHFRINERKKCWRIYIGI